MIILVPVSQYRVTYELGAGRPYSHFERMLLSAMLEGATVLSDLQEIFHVHPRLIIEGLVTLTQAGWLAVGGAENNGFVLTAEGRQAASADSAPSTTSITSRSVFLLLERVTGCIFPKDEVRFVTKKELSVVWNECGRLRSDFVYNDLDEGQVQHLLPRKKGSWVRWIGPIDMVSKDSNWIPVNVDVDSRTITGLPDRLVDRLKPAILDEADRLVGQLSEQAISHIWEVVVPKRAAQPAQSAENSRSELQPSLWRNANINEADLIFSSTDHEALLLETVRGAKKAIIISSDMANVACLEFYKKDFEDAIGRGVNIDVLWGRSNINTTSAPIADFFRRLAFEAKKLSLAGAVKFNTSPCQSRANLILADSGERFVALVGSYSWLNGRGNDFSPEVSQRSVSLRLSDGRLIGVLARCLAGIWSMIDTEVLSSTADRWRRVASDLEMDSYDEAGGGAVAVKVILDQEHSVIAYGLNASIPSTLLIATDYLGSIADLKIIAALEKLQPLSAAEIYFGGRDEAALDTVEYENVTLVSRPGLRANVLIRGATSHISSYNFLQPKLEEGDRGGRYVGIEIESDEISSLITRKLNLTQ